MFNTTLRPVSASYQWIQGGTSTGRLSSGNGGSDAAAIIDQYLTIVNGSFYLTTLPSFSQTLLIAAADLNVFASSGEQLTHTGLAASSASSSSSSKSAASARSRRTRAMEYARPTHERTLRPKQKHQQLGEMRPHPRLQLSAEERAAEAVLSLSAGGGVFQYSSYVLSPNQASMLFAVNCTQLYRHSSYCSYLIYDITAKTMTRLTAPATSAAAGAPLRLAIWSPDSTKLVYVASNNIFVYTLASKATVTVTTDGAWDVVLYGVPDWVYEEEVLESTIAVWWSPLSDALIYLRTNESLVPSYSFDFYTQPYNQPFSYKYPKAGATNSIVDIQLFNLTSATTFTFAGLRSLVNYEYMYNVAWMSPSDFFVRVFNREQNVASLLKLSAASGGEIIRLLSSSTAAYYFEPQNQLTSLWPLPFFLDQVIVDDHAHLGLFDAGSGALVRYVTRGDYDVLVLNEARVSSSSVFITYTRETTQTLALIASPALFSVTLLPALNASSLPVQLVLPPGDDPSVALTSQSASFSPSGAYFLLQESANVPQTTLYAINATTAAPLADQAAYPLLVLADNSALDSLLRSQYDMPRIYYTQIPSGAVAGEMLSVSILVPSSVDISSCSGGASPVLLYAYSGPGSQTVTTSYPFAGSFNLFHTLLASKYGYIIVTVDTVGTAGKGERYRKSHTYKQLGLVERADILSTASWVSAQCWSNSDRISYWGWSYGGFLTSFTAAAGSGLFDAIISVAPVTSWALYDSVYTERYMLTPAENQWGYLNTSVIASVSPAGTAVPSAFDTDTWHLFGGTADDNVHFQNSALLVDALIDADVAFSTFYFPNRAHSLAQWHTGAAPKYLYQSIIRILTRDDTFAGSQS